VPEVQFVRYRIIGLQQNCRADKLATAALIAAVEANKLISSIFPLEKVCVDTSGEQVTGSPKNAITEFWGEQMAQAPVRIFLVDISMMVT
jgi:hypothetical protein